LVWKKGEEKEVTIPSSEAYGEYNEDMKKDLPKSELPPEQEPKAGMTLVMTTPEGHQVPIKIAEVKDDVVVLDMNHPLAGKKLIFKIKILEIN